MSLQKKRFLSKEEHLSPEEKRSRVKGSTDETIMADMDEMSNDSVVEGKITDESEVTLKHVLQRLDKLDSVHRTVTHIDAEVATLKHDLRQSELQYDEIRKEVADLKLQSEKLNNLEQKVQSYSFSLNEAQAVQLRSLRLYNEKLEDRLDNLDNYSRRENLILDGVQETAQENCFNVVSNLMMRLGLPPFKIQRCHRLGGPHANKPRPLITRFAFYQDKITLMSYQKQLRQNNIYLRDDLSPSCSRKQAVLRPVVRFLQSYDNRVRMVQDSIIFRGKRYNFQSVVGGKIPIDISQVSQKFVNGMTFFAGEVSPLSNLHPCDLMIDLIPWRSVEHYYQYHKCMEHGASDLAAEIYCASTPRDAMVLGSKVKASHEWTTNKGVGFIKTAVLEKFNQPHLKSAILNTRGLIVEATKHSIFGVGLPFTSTSLQDQSAWQGSNLMGQILTECRDHIKDRSLQDSSASFVPPSLGSSQYRDFMNQQTMMLQQITSGPMAPTSQETAPQPHIMHSQSGEPSVPKSPTQLNQKQALSMGKESQHPSSPQHNYTIPPGSQTNSAPLHIEQSNASVHLAGHSSSLHTVHHQTVPQSPSFQSQPLEHYKPLHLPEDLLQPPSGLMSSWKPMYQPYKSEHLMTPPQIQPYHATMGPMGPRTLFQPHLQTPPSSHAMMRLTTTVTPVSSNLDGASVNTLPLPVSTSAIKPVVTV